MKGLFAQLTPEQQKAALEYRGPENSGREDFPKRSERNECKRNECKRMTWHYLPVWKENRGERYYFMIEVYIDEEGLLSGWTDGNPIEVIGDCPDDLSGALEHMLNDSKRWKPVAFDELASGMRLEKTDPSPGESSNEIPDACFY